MTMPTIYTTRRRILEIIEERAVRNIPDVVEALEEGPLDEVIALSHLLTEDAAGITLGSLGLDILYGPIETRPEFYSDGTMSYVPLKKELSGEKWERRIHACCSLLEHAIIYLQDRLEDPNAKRLYDIVGVAANTSKIDRVIDIIEEDNLDVLFTWLAKPYEDIYEIFKHSLRSPDFYLITKELMESSLVPIHTIYPMVREAVD